MEGPLLDCSFHPHLLTNMAAIGNSCFWLVYFYKDFVRWNRLVKWIEISEEASMEGPL
jgi:hypothetical protein